MVQKTQKINNPLTIIAIFAALAEVNATVAIGLIEPDLQHIFIWFVIGFPSLLVILFFCTLNFNTRVMYSPSDYKDDKTFVATLYGKLGIKNQPISSHNLLIDKIKSLESKINKEIKDALSELEKNSNSKPDEIKKLKKNILTVTDNKIKEFTNDLVFSNKTKSLLSNFIEYPAYYVLIFAIITEECSSSKDIKSVRSVFIPAEWEKMNAINELASIGMIKYNKGHIKFSVVEELKEDLNRWAKFHKEKIIELSKLLHVFINNRDRDIWTRIINISKEISS